jgi:hypothetical protein
MEVSGQLHTPTVLTLGEKFNCTDSIGRWVGPIVCLVTSEDRYTSCLVCNVQCMHWLVLYLTMLSVKLTTILCRCQEILVSANLNFLEPSGPLQACNGTALP